jgi:hypothetical protein
LNPEVLEYVARTQFQNNLPFINNLLFSGR